MIAYPFYLHAEEKSLSDETQNNRLVSEWTWLPGLNSLKLVKDVFNVNEREL